MNTVKVATQWSILTLITLVFPGCNDVALDATTSVNATPKEIIEPLAPDEIRRDESIQKKSSKAANNPKSAKSASESNSKKSTPKLKSTPTARLGLWPAYLAATLAYAEDERPIGKQEISLESIKVADLSKTIAADKKSRLTMVDVWSTTCGPCMLNMPHVVESENKYRPRGLAVVTLSTDDPEDEKAVARAKEFLVKQKAFKLKNYLDSTFQDAFEHLDFTTMPAVLLYDGDGKLLKKYTWDDPDNQFTYDEVDKSVAAYLDGKPMPKDSGSLPVAK